MLRSSFRSLATRVYPGNTPRKPLAAALAAALLLAGCGGGGGGGETAEAVRTVSGAGFAFAAPAAWRVERTPRGVEVAPRGDGATLLTVERFRLLKRYRPELFAAVVRELDRNEEKLAAKLRARIERRAVVRVAGRRARQYDLAYVHADRDLRQRTTYVLAGLAEYVVACRWAPDADGEATAACARMLRTFRLG